MKKTILLLITALAPATVLAEGPYVFHAVAPCRLVDTRGTNGPTGGPALVTGQNQPGRFFPVQGNCGVPIGAKAVSANFTITQPTGDGHLRLYPSDQALVNVSTLNWVTNQTLANGGIVPLAPYNATTGDLAAWVLVTGNAPNTVHLIIDVNGYFTAP